MGLYLSNGYLDFRGIRDKGYPYNFLIGGRGTGKTYGALCTSVEDRLPFALMRRRQAQVDIINKPEFSPMRPVCADTGLNITMVSVVHGISAFVEFEEVDGKRVILGEPLGFTCALSTLAKVRGFDASTLRLLLYDEFIPEKSERALPHEADTLFNAYETMNRNRELEGEAPLQLFCMANSNDLAAPVIVKLDLVKRLERMADKGTELWTDDRRGLLVALLHDSPISARKRDTALYRLTEGSEFAAMALDNRFSYEDRGRIISRPLTEYKPIVTVGEITIYQHKAKPMFYVSTHKAGACISYATGETELQRFRRAYGYLLWRECMADHVEYEDYLCQVHFTEYCS